MAQKQDGERLRNAEGEKGGKMIGMKKRKLKGMPCSTRGKEGRETRSLADRGKGLSCT